MLPLLHTPKAATDLRCMAAHSAKTSSKRSITPHQLGPGIKKCARRWSSVQKPWAPDTPAITSPAFNQPEPLSTVRRDRGDRGKHTCRRGLVGCARISPPSPRQLMQTAILTPSHLPELPRNQPCDSSQSSAKVCDGGQHVSCRVWHVLSEHSACSLAFGPPTFTR